MGRLITFGSERLNVSQWAARFGVTQSAISHRIRKHGAQKAIAIGFGEDAGPRGGARRRPDPVPDRYCERCGKQLERRRFPSGSLESKADFAKRRFCPSPWRTSRPRDGKRWSHPLYVIWQGIYQRCFNPRAQAYPKYGARGITMHKAWADDFWQFVADVGERPSPTHSIDRYPDNDGNYEPGNVRWATRAEQTRNSRVNKHNMLPPEAPPLREFAPRLGITRQAAWHRIVRFGWKPVWNGAGASVRHPLPPGFKEQP
jgi:hypothetical protein